MLRTVVNLIAIAAVMALGYWGMLQAGFNPRTRVGCDGVGEYPLRENSAEGFLRQPLLITIFLTPYML